jgi:hypothetical protein
VADVEERVGVAADAEETPVLEAGATDLMNMTTDDLVGRTLLGPGDEVVGDILEIVRDGDTPPRGYAVVAVNDESGVGKKEILIGLDTLRVESEGASLLAPRTAAELAAYPEFEEDAYQRYEGPLADIGKAAP